MLNIKKRGKNPPELNLKGLTSDVTSFIIINIFISNCNLITLCFSVTLTDYSYIYFVVKHVTSYSPTLIVTYRL